MHLLRFCKSQMRIIASLARLFRSLCTYERKARDANASNGISHAIAREELAGLSFMLRGRLVALGLLAIWVMLTLPLERSTAYLLAIVAFALLGALPYLLVRREIAARR